MTAPKTGRARVERLLEQIRTLGVKAQLQLFDSVKEQLVIEGRHDVRFTARSVLEYKRSTKEKPWDAAIEDWIASFAAGDVFFDIGANTGAFSLLAGKLHGERISVYAVEPGVESFEALTRNILANGLSDIITPLPVGLFDATRVETFNYHSLGAGSARHALGAPASTHDAFTPVASQSILAFRLDDLVEWFRLPRPTRIKLDVDGIESRIIAGAARTLSSGRCELCVEVTQTSETDDASDRLRDDLGRLGFTMARAVEHDRTSDVPRVYDVFYERR